MTQNKPRPRHDWRQLDAARIRAIRVRHGWTMQQMADLLTADAERWTGKGKINPVTKGHVDNWEKGRNRPDRLIGPCMLRLERRKVDANDREAQ